MRQFTQKLSVVISTLLFSGGVLFAQTITVSGTVRDENGDPLVGAAVVDKNNPDKGVIVDLEGKYQIKVDSNAFLEYSFLGYESKIENVGGRKEIDVQLKPKTSTLNEVVVIGYGTSKKSDLTGSVAVVNVEGLKDNAVSNVSQSLQGRIAGVDISTQSGAPGESQTIQIRGARSISAGNEPLIIVDGMMDVVDDLGDINAADIVSISVLKDVSSTAIYGSRGANGVILVTTNATASNKQTGSLNISLRAKAGVSEIANSVDIMNATEIAQWRNMVYDAMNNWDPAFTDRPYVDPTVFGEGTDWVKVLSRRATYQDYYLGLNGSAGAFSYNVSLGYNDEQGVIIGTDSRKVYGIVSFTVKMRPWLTSGIKTQITDAHTDQPLAAIGGTNSNAAIMLSPILTTSDSWNWYGDDESSGGAIFNNPYTVATMSQKWNNRNTIIFAPWAKATIGKYLTGNVKFSYARNNTWNFSFYPSTLPTYVYNKTGGAATRGAYLKQTIINENTLSYKQIFGKSTLEALAGLSFERKKIDNENLNGDGFLNDDVTFHNMAGIMYTDNLKPTSYQTINTKASVFGRFGYSYDRRYYVTLTARADGASNFAENKKWGFFPALALRWSIVNEKWFHNAYWLNDLSIRASAGRSGNDAISNYMSLATLNSGKTHWTFGDSREVAYTPAKLANSNLTWETTDALNLGFDFEGFHGRLGFNIDAYLSYTHDLLLSMRTSQVTGYDTYFNNAGSTRNEGIEMTLNTKNIVSRNFKWNTTFTIAHNNQLTLDTGEGDRVVPTYINPRESGQYLYGYRKGYPVNALWGYQYEGVWSSAEQYERNLSTHAYCSGNMMNGVNNNLGRSKFADLNHDGILNEQDVVYLGTSDPTVYGGLQNDFVIGKRLKLGVYFAYSLGGKIYNLSELWLATGSQSFNKYRYMLKAWTPENADSNIPAAYREDIYGCSRFIHDASYFRFKTLSMDYDIPLGKEAMKHIKKVTVGLSAENIFLWKNYNGFDPDVNTSSAVYRLDNGSYPRPRTVIGRVSMSF